MQSFNIGDINIKPEETVKLLGVNFDYLNLMKKQISDNGY